MSRTNWKGLELLVARALGVERYSKKHLGEEGPDVVKELDDYSIIIETKNRESVDVEESLKQVEGYAKKGDIPVFIFRKTRKHSLEAYIRLKHFRLLYKKLKEKNALLSGNIILQLKYGDFIHIVGQLDDTDKSSKAE